MPEAKSLLEMQPGDVLVVGPGGCLTIAIQADGSILNEVICCTIFRASHRTSALTEVRNMVFDDFDDTGTRRVVGGNGGASNG